MISVAHRSGERGVTLIELVVVLAIAIILIAALSYEYQGWRARYRAEGEVKMLYSDIMKARTLAMTRGKTYFVNLPTSEPKKLLVFEDSEPPPDGNGRLTWTDSMIINETTTYNITSAERHFIIDSRGQLSGVGGMLESPRTMVLDLSSIDVEPDYNCIELLATRVNLGFWNGTNCTGK